MTQPNPECVFTKVFFGDEEALADAMPQIPKGASDTEVLELLNRRICPIGNCCLRGTDIYNYSAGNMGPLQQITERVPADCTWNTIPHHGLR